MPGIAFHSQVIETPFYSRIAPRVRSNAWSRWAGYKTVAFYDSMEIEYFAIRNAATLFDLSPLIKYRIAGRDALAYLDRLLTRRLDRLVTGRVTYALWCDDQGKLLDDGTLFRLGEDEFRLCSQERHLCWLQDSAIGFEVEIEDESEAVAGLALQGPTSCAVLKGLGLEGIAMLRPFACRDYDFEGGSLMVSRTGFTGDLGYELWVAPRLAEALWDRLMEAGALHGLRPIGSLALDMARIEAGFIQAGADFVPAEHALRATRGRSPFELGLGHLVHFDKGHFTGRRALLEEKEKGSRYCLVGLELEGNKAAKDALIYHSKTKAVGAVTSAIWSPTCKRNIAIATLRKPYGAEVSDDLWAEIYVRKELKWERSMVRCWPVERPFFNPPRRSAIPALDM